MNRTGLPVSPASSRTGRSLAGGSLTRTAMICRRAASAPGTTASTPRWNAKPDPGHPGRRPGKHLVRLPPRPPCHRRRSGRIRRLPPRRHHRLVRRLPGRHHRSGVGPQRHALAGPGVLRGAPPSLTPSAPGRAPRHYRGYAGRGFSQAPSSTDIFVSFLLTFSCRSTRDELLQLEKLSTCGKRTDNVSGARRIVSSGGSPTLAAAPVVTKLTSPQPALGRMYRGLVQWRGLAELAGDVAVVAVAEAELDVVAGALTSRPADIGSAVSPPTRTQILVGRQG